MRDSFHHFGVGRQVCIGVCVVLATAGCGNSYVVPNGGSAPAEAGNTSGPVLDMTGDITIAGSDNFQMIGQPGARCIIRGNGHSINTTIPWTGHLSIRSCDIIGLGTADTPGIHLNMHGTSSAVIDDSTFDASGQVHVLTYDQSTVDFSHNTVLASSLVPAVAVIRFSQAAFFAQGDGTGKNRFAGNLILHSYGDFRTNNWMIGGDSAAEGNRFIGLRTGLYLEGAGIVVRGNYIHTIYPTSLPDLPHGQEVSAVAVQGAWPDLLVEHNLIRHGHWVIRGVSGEVRYNAIVDADDSDWIREPQTNSKIHHNVFVNYAVPGAETNAIDPNPTVQAGIEGIDAVTSGVQIWANTFDGGGPSRFFRGPTISVAYGSALDSARSNLFMRFPYQSGSAGIATGSMEVPGSPPVLGYADYNLFFNQGGDAIDNYAIAVPGKVERQDSGFGANDVPVLGAKDAQVDPQVTGPFAQSFPWTDDEIASGAVTVTDMLGYFRKVYGPRPGSPLIDTGDPQDGKGADIGAIGAGISNPGDRFGDFPAGSQPAVDKTEGGVAASSRRDSDGPLTLRCSTRPIGDSREGEGSGWLLLGLVLLCQTLGHHFCGKPPSPKPPFPFQ